MQISPISNFGIKSNINTTNNDELKQRSKKVANNLLFASFIGISGLAITAQCYGRKTTPTKLLKEWGDSLLNKLKEWIPKR